MVGTTPNAAAIENITIIGGLIGLQFIYAGNSVLVGYLMLLGLNPSTIIIFCALATSLVFSPLSFYHERSSFYKTIYDLININMFPICEDLEVDDLNFFSFIWQEPMAQEVESQVMDTIAFNILWRVSMFFCFFYFVHISNYL